MISFTIPGEPVAKGRARSFVRNGHVAHYTPEKTARYENLVKLAAQQAMNGKPPIEGPITLSVSAYMPIPQSWSKKKQECPGAHTKRPDLDNIIKSIKDGLNGVAWHDDSQVTDIVASKSYYREPHVHVSVNLNGA